ncbi:MAG TPA: NADH-quinone oxidoreductase subunit C [Nitrososphaera sp.]|jgi:NADH-quinone oxidoreductase subunit C|nr:NADH-quinone oxidoreductase subunit C [Nitrososphaera sp.]
MSANNKEEPKKVAASSQSKHSTTSTTDTTTKQQQTPPSTQPKQIPAKPSAPTTTTGASAATATTASKPSVASSPAKTQPEPPPFEKGLLEQIKNKFGDTVKVVFIKPLRIKIQVEPQDIVGVASFLRDSMGFDHAESVAGTDYPKDNQIEVIYHLGSYSREELAAHILWLTTRTNRDDARLPTLINIYKSVEYHERECYEMLGVYFEGHPRNERFLLPEDWADIPPLRKDFRIKGR